MIPTSGTGQKAQEKSEVFSAPEFPGTDRFLAVLSDRWG
jgi:hypothetical protein